MSPRTEELLSYFTGLARPGETFEIRRKTLYADMGWRSQWCYYKCLNHLIASGHVKRISCGAQGTTGALVVERRLEAA